jgi:protein-S-isoprenylcysteine O-methyltransferase Ste14
MATPFAAFFYSIYGPILNFTNHHLSLAWLNDTFLPHIVRDTSSFLLNLHEPVGLVLFMIGILGFSSGVVQVYYAKLFSKKAVLGGLYRFIRHPQYLSLIVWGAGLVLLWPRTIVLLFFVTMIFIYYRLARIEENECAEKYGEVYREYKQKKGMFFPVKIIPHILFPQFIVSKPVRHLLFFASYLVTIALVIISSDLLRSWSLNNLYAVYSADAAYISITKTDERILQDLIDCALADPEVQRRLSQNSLAMNEKYINYVMPADLFMLEIPMNKPENVNNLHFLSKAQSTEKIKIIFTRAEIRGKKEVRGQEILKRVVFRKPVMEVYIDLIPKKIMNIKDPPVGIAMGDNSMPVY